MDKSLNQPKNDEMADQRCYDSRSQNGGGPP
jgi:hypothetical protein